MNRWLVMALILIAIELPFLAWGHFENGKRHGWCEAHGYQEAISGQLVWERPIRCSSSTEGLVP